MPPHIHVALASCFCAAGSSWIFQFILAAIVRHGVFVVELKITLYGSIESDLRAHTVHWLAYLRAYASYTMRMLNSN